MSGSSTAKSQRGWRRGRGKGDASSKKTLPLARPASSAALVLRVLDDEEEANKSLPLTIVTDDFALGRVLGRGQFGTTRLATRRDSGQLFACKIILKRKLSTPSAVAAVRREIAIMRRLDHPSIVKLHGVYEDDRVSSFWFSFLSLRPGPTGAAVRPLKISDSKLVFSLFRSHSLRSLSTKLPFPFSLFTKGGPSHRRALRRR